MNRFFLLFFTGCFAVTVFAQEASSLVRQKLSLDKGWLFHLGDIPFVRAMGANAYGLTKAGEASGAAAVQYDDKDWRKLNLPHDWSIEMPADSTIDYSHGYRKRGYGWYRRYFKLDAADKGKNIELQFDGISTNATIWVNGIVVHRNWCGYTSSYIDITPLVKYGKNDANIIAVQVDAVSHEGWWYEGSGIYRHTWLVKRPAVHITTDGVYAQPIKKQDGSWQIPAEVTLANAGTTAQNATVEVSVLDKQSNVAAIATSNIQVPVLGSGIANVNLTIANPTLWDIENPYLYRVITSIKQNGQTIDELTTKCGFRTIQFRADSGFYLNGKHVKLKGTCNHQDHAGLGVAIPDAMWEFRISKLKEMGSNAYRCSHNPPAAEFLDACDSMGMLVLDENKNFNTSDEYIRQLQWLIRRDRNHPSVILWSVFNEEPLQGDARGYEMVRYMRARVRDLDTTRPVTAAQSGGQLNPLNVSHAADVVGFNYQPGNYDAYHQKYPDKPMTSTEDASSVSVRGEYATDLKKNLISDYDVNANDWGKGWGGWTTPFRQSWKNIDTRPFLAGGFIWTGFAYHGEPQPNEWPAIGSVFGLMDMCGFPKTGYYLQRAMWRNDIPVLDIVPHWNWPKDSIGKNIKVIVISNADNVTLLLNGKKISNQKADKYEMNTWMVPYAPGRLEAISYDSKGKELKRQKAATTDAPCTLKLTPYRTAIKNDGWDVVPITVEVLDKKGRHVPTANIPITFNVSDGASIVSVGNGDPNGAYEPEKGNKRSLFNGWAQLIIQSKESATGTITVTADSPGMQTATITILLANTTVPPFVPAVEK